MNIPLFRTITPPTRIAVKRYTIFDFAKTFFFVSFFLSFLWMVVIVTTAKAEPLGDDMRELEFEVWTAEDSELFKIEKKIVEQIQLFPYSAKAHYLLSHLYFRMYSNSPSELYLLKGSSDMAEQAIDLDKKSDFGYIALADVLDLMGNQSRNEKTD